MVQVQKADPIARKKAMVILLIGTIIGMLVIGTFTYYEMAIHAWLGRNIEWVVNNSWTVFLFGLVLAIPLLVLSGFLFIYGQKVVKTERIPPPTYAVTRDTKIHTGRQAVLRGRIIQFLSLFLLLAGTSIPILLCYIFDRVFRLT